MGFAPFFFFSSPRSVCQERICAWVHYPGASASLQIGNKCDLRHARAVETRRAADFAKKEGMFFFETSALDTTNVDEAFTQVRTRPSGLAGCAARIWVRHLHLTSTALDGDLSAEEAEGAFWRWFG
jgi:hypothetical protein